jgi:two-component system, OmpR family, phosphate regulon response regulator OmpR
MRNLLRRSQPKAPKINAVRFGDFVFEIENGTLTRGLDTLRLTGREKDILRQLAQSLGQPVARSALQPNGASEDARAIDVQMTRLRQKIETDPSNPKYLQTVRGQGYCLFAESV